LIRYTFLLEARIVQNFSMLHYPHRVVFYRPDGQVMFDHVDDLGHKVRFSAGKRRWYADLSEMP